METVNYRFMFLSIIIPVYNTPELYLRECLNSCIKQNISPNNYEILCVDDGSEFACLSVLYEYKRAYPNIFVVKYEDNERNVTYSYTDLLTRTVQVDVFDGETYNPLLPPIVDTKA